MTPRVRKRCLKCGHIASVKPRQRKCYQPRFGQGSYACWGELVPNVKFQSAVTVGEIATVANVRPQDVAEKKLAAARKMVSEKTKAMARLATSLRMWEARASRFAKQASMTDDEIAAAKAKRIADADRRRAEKARRGIKIGGML